ncbi:MAG: DUF4255 domain-containing protein [Bacteroidota bacterium]
MIHTALEFLAGEVNTYLKLKNDITNDLVSLTNVATQEGNWAIPNNRLGLSLINIEEEKIFKEQRTTFVNSSGLAQHYNPEIKLNLYVLISANYTSGDGDDTVEYLEGLKQLSYVLRFFQGKNVFTNDNAPGLAALDMSVEKLVVELFSYTFEQLYNFWTVLGAKYLPSILYKVRLITLQEENVLDQKGVVESIGINSLHKR